MAVYWRATRDTPILSGHWVCERSKMIDGCCGRPHEVTKVSNTTVSWKEGKEFRTFGKSSIAFFADTEEEALAVYALMRAKHDAIEKSKARISKEFDAKIAAHFAPEESGA